MGVYRVEESPNNRAGCAVKACKEQGIKIKKGELRYAIQVTIQEHQSWQYRHWGCVTPKQIENLIETCEGDTDLVDGYDDLSKEYQEKVDCALRDGHVHDDDWKDDPELNRPGAKKSRTPKNKKAERGDGEEAGASDAKPKRKAASKKAKDENDGDQKEASKKKRGRPTKKEVDGDDAAPLAKKGRRISSKSNTEVESGDDKAPLAKKAKTKRAAAKVGKDIEAADEAEEEEAPKARRGKKKVAAPDEEKVPQKRGRKKKATSDDE